MPRLLLLPLLLGPTFGSFEELGVRHFATSYFLAQEASVAPRVSTTRQVIQTNGFAFGSSPITKVRRA